MRVANGLSFCFLRFTARRFSDRRLCLFAVCLGLLPFQACALLQRPSDIAAPVETPVKRSPAVGPKFPQTGLASWYGAL